MKRHERYLSKRDKRVLRFLYRYRAATQMILQEACFSKTDSDANGKRVLKRLESQKLIQQHRSVNGFDYVTITVRGMRTMGFPARSQRSLTEQSLPVVLAVAEYCVSMRLERQTVAEFRDLYPELWWDGARSANYVRIKSQDGVKIRMLLIDRGGAARRIRSRVNRVIAQRSRLPKFKLLIQAGRFEIVVLTGLPEQQAKIAKQIERSSFGAVAVSTALIPGLSSLLTLSR
ncbi:hypothetical protein [Novipirellula artificiosorum]|uniref:Replication-relaxation n=1 Tax=Novipirellula artificiosorum TaxID=2528016 RepID=A0A5C6DF76_9BACT|nr:hypothetical protein [Novipirellula artificiosorum]TWU34885.1 hypothetical protein Poly41_40280 [Novipirellula artificiosorum]